MFHYLIRFGLIVFLWPLLLGLILYLLPFDVLPSQVVDAFEYFYLRISYIAGALPFMRTPIDLVFGFIIPMEIYLAAFLITQRIYRMVIG